MKAKLISILCFSSFGIALSQSTVDSAKTKKAFHYEPNFIVGVDVLNLGVGAFDDRKLFQGFVSSRINKKVHAVVDFGYDKNIYQKNGYDVAVDGFFLKAGGFYMLTQDPDNDFNGFYGGGKLAGTFYNQSYFKIPVRGSGGGDAFVSLPQSQQSSYWIEAVFGGRIQLFETNFFIDVNLQPRYLVYTTKQDEIYPMVVPGFGKSSGKFNMGFSWNIAYKF